MVTLQIECEEPGAEVRLDGQLIFRAPGQFESVVLRGEHSIAATKPGFESLQLHKQLESDEEGNPVVFKLKLYRPEDLYVYTRPYPLWIPITITTVGAVVAGGGLFADWYAQQRYTKAGETVDNNPGCAPGCLPDDETAKYQKQADTFKLLSIVGYAAGGALFATGVTLWALDHRRAHRVTPEERQKFSVIPIVGPSGGGVWGSMQF